MMEGPGADSEEKREPVSDIDTTVVDSLKVLDLKWPIREADIRRQVPHWDLPQANSRNLFQTAWILRRRPMLLIVDKLRPRAI